MIRRVHIASLAVVALLGASAGSGCLGSPTQPSPLPLGQSFELRSGTTAALRGGLKVTFDSVGSDSRCPMDALCVWAGDAVVKLALSQSGVGPGERELHTQPTGSEATYSTYSIKLQALSPYPRSDRQIRPEDYVATLTVSAP